MASNSHGTNNELEMAQYLNDKKYKDLNLNMKEFIKYVCKVKELPLDDNMLIKSEYVTNNKLKQDIYIALQGKKIGVSLKMGSGNSCHQEKIEDFVKYIKAELNATEEICDLWRFFVWADGTTDGTGSLEKNSDDKIICRFDATGFKKRYPEKRAKLQKFLDENKEALLNRAIFVGKYNSNVDFVYHGTYREGRWISKKEVIDFQIQYTKKSNRACFCLGNLTVQAWNVSLKGNTEYKRGEIQIKYGNMENDFKILLKDSSDTVGTFLGDMEEYGLTHLLNKNKLNPMWKVLLPDVEDFSDYYLVKVSTTQMSKLSERKVKTKSDAYVVKAKLDRSFLLGREYVIDENDLKEVSYEPQAGTGISIKMKSSKNYTFQKFTRNSFCKAFNELDEAEFWLISLLIYSAANERYKNERIINDFNLTFNAYLEKVKTIMGINVSNTDSVDFWNSVRRAAQSKV